jgi:hypothetical protein
MDPLALLDAETERANRDFYFRKARAAFRDGLILWGLYFLDAADSYAEPDPEQAGERISLLLGAMEAVAERPEGAEHA